MCLQNQDPSVYQASSCELVPVKLVVKSGLTVSQDSSCELVPVTMSRKSGLTLYQESLCELVPVMMLPEVLGATLAVRSLLPPPSTFGWRTNSRLHPHILSWP